MKKNTDEKSTLQQFKELNHEYKQAHKQEVDEIVNQTYHQTDSVSKLRSYNQTKKMKWWTYLISLGTAILLTAVSVMLAYLVSFKVANYFDLAIVLSLVVVMFSFNYLKNKNAAKYFDDKKRRYQRSLTHQEATIFLILKTLFLTLILFLPVAISFMVMF